MQRPTGSFSRRRIVARVIHRLKWRQPRLEAGELTLLVAGRHGDTRVRSGRIDGASVVGCKEGAGVAASEDNNATKIVSKRVDDLGQRRVCQLRIGFHQPRLAHHVQVIGFDDQRALTAGAALIALVTQVLRHGREGPDTAPRREFRPALFQ